MHAQASKWSLHMGLPLVPIAAILLALPSCIIRTLTPYYLPAAPGGSVSRAMEPRTNSVITFQREGVVIGVCVRFHLERIEAVISFEIPDHKTVRLYSNQTEVIESNGQRWSRELAISGSDRSKETRVDEPTVGKNRAWSLFQRRGLSNTRMAAFFFRAPLFPRPGPGSFSLQIPGFEINEVPVQLPPIEFTFDEEKLWSSVP